MNEQRRGILQLIVVCTFIAASIFASMALNYVRTAPETREGGARELIVEMMTVEPSNYPIRFTETGIVQARNVVSIVPQVSGRVTEIRDDFFEGGNFDAGALLFQIDKRDYINEIRRIRAELARAQTALKLEEAEAQAAVAEWKLLHPKKSPPPLVRREPQLEEARASIEAAKAQLATAQLNLERSSYRLPFDGRVINSNLALGQFISAGQSYGEVFDIRSLEVRASIPDQDLKWLYQSDEPNIVIQISHLGSDHRYEGYLKRKAASVEAQTRFSNVYFGFRESAEILIPGLFATIEIEATTLKGVYQIPAAAIQKQRIIWAVNADNELVKVTPDIVFVREQYALVRGLSSGQRIVISRLQGAEPGMRVRTREESAIAPDGNESDADASEAMGNE